MQAEPGPVGTIKPEWFTVAVCTARQLRWR